MDNLAAEVLASSRMQEAGATTDLVVSAVRIFGGILLVIAVLYVLAGFLAFAGRNWARIVTAVFTAGFAIVLAAALVASGGAIDTIALASVLLVLILGAVVDPVQPRWERLVRGTSVSFARLGGWTPSRPSSSRAPAPSSPVG